MSSLNAWLLFVFALLQAIDAWTTIHVIEKGGYEQNPALAALFARIGLKPGLALVKLVAVGVMAYFAMFDEPLAIGLLGGACCLYVAVVCHNFRSWG